MTRPCTLGYGQYEQPIISAKPRNLISSPRRSESPPYVNADCREKRGDELTQNVALCKKTRMGQYLCRLPITGLVEALSMLEKTLSTSTTGTFTGKFSRGNRKGHLGEVKPPREKQVTSTLKKP